MQSTNRVADSLRKLALNEGAKAYVMTHPELSAVAKRVAQRYVAGEDLEQAIQAAAAVSRKGYTATIDFMGESTRSEQEARAALDEFLRLTDAIKVNKLRSSVSLDLSHIGSLVGLDLGTENARTLAAATDKAGIEMMISMEGSDRVDEVLSIHKELCAEFKHVGITVQARLHRTRQDLFDLLKRPGRIRLVKGAYYTPLEIAYARDTNELHVAYDSYAKQLLESGHPCSIATHDWDRLKSAERVLKDVDADRAQFTFEFLSGLGIEQERAMFAKGFRVQEYIVYGLEWWLYVCNRIAEEPSRLFDAITDAIKPD